MTTIPSAMFIQAAVDAVAIPEDPAAMTERIARELVELNQANVADRMHLAVHGTTESELPFLAAFQSGYILGLETARALLAGGVKNV